MKNKSDIKIAVAGTGYVGLSLAVVLARSHDVTAVDIVQERVDKINGGESPIREKEIERLLKSGTLHFRATTDAEEAYRKADFVIVAVPTDYNEITHFFDVSNVDSVIDLVLRVNPQAAIVIKSTIPIGYTEIVRKSRENEKHEKPNILFSPEFLREGRSVEDLTHPSRIIVGFDDIEQWSSAEEFATLLESASENGAKLLMMKSREAEAVKLFANTYLAMRVAFFNELDTFAEDCGLSSASIINGVCADSRIGKGYNNPSFGYGGYCFPKDTKQLLSNFIERGTPQCLMEAIVMSNDVRKKFIAGKIGIKADNGIGAEKKTIGVYRLAMKSGSDNHRQSAIIDIIDILIGSGNKIIIYDESLKNNGVYNGCEIVHDIIEFKQRSDIIITNRLDDNMLDDEREKVYSRDVFGID